jgi:hypothetical protein
LGRFAKLPYPVPALPPVDAVHVISPVEFDAAEDDADALPAAFDDEPPAVIALPAPPRSRRRTEDEAAPVALSWIKKGRNWHLVENGRISRKRATVSPRDVERGPKYRAVIKGFTVHLAPQAAGNFWIYAGTIPAAKRWCEQWHRDQAGFGNIPPVTIA